MIGRIAGARIAGMAFIIISMNGCTSHVTNCGHSPNALRVLSEGPLRVPGRDDEVKINIQATDIVREKGRLFVHKSVGQNSSTFVSEDHGRSWHKIEFPECTQISAGLTVGSWTPCIMSRASIDVCYKYRDSTKGSELDLSKNTGKTWTTLYPKYENNLWNGHYEIVDTSPNDPARIYAMLWSDEMTKTPVVSNDYGATFTRIDKVSYECRGRANCIYSVSPYPEPALSISTDSGISWHKAPGANVLFTPLYNNEREPDLLKTQREEIDEKEVLVGIENAVQQIECDAKRADIFYILNRLKGIYRTVDNGSTFTVLPIGDSKYLDIGEIVTDPVDGGILYATIGRSRLYRSDDYGCSWKLLTIPDK